jgi:peptide/nickel transport system permease protein
MMAASGVLRVIKSSKSGLFGMIVLAILISVAALAPVLPLQDPVKINLAQRMKPPAILTGKPGPWLGTDELGRDILSRTVYGARITLAVVSVAVLFSGFIGITLGLVSGFFGGWVDRILMRIVDLQLAFPLMLLALTVIAVLGPSLRNLIVVLALDGWVRFARIVRAEVLSVRGREFVLGARAAGAGSLRIMFHHILPNVLSPILIIGTIELARLVLLESSLSFLGLGIQPPFASWGRMLADGRNYLNSPLWISVVPGTAIVLTVLSVNLVGDFLRDQFDPKLRTV